MQDANEKQNGKQADSMTWKIRVHPAALRRNGLVGLAGLVTIGLVGSPSVTTSVGAQAQTRAANAPVRSTATGLLVTGAVGQDLHLTLDDLKKMERKTVSTRDHAGEMHQYDGVPIGALLAEAGVPQGAALRGKSMALTVVAEGTDGYRAIFSLAELDDDFAAESVLIVDSADGQPLTPDQGPLRLVVPGDKRQGRWVRMLKSITVVNVGGGPSN